MKKSIICKEFTISGKSFQIWCNSSNGATVIAIDGVKVVMGNLWDSFNKAISGLSNDEIEVLGEAISDIDIEISA